jgi:hypothetical protein
VLGFVSEGYRRLNAEAVLRRIRWAFVAKVFGRSFGRVLTF